MKCLWKNAIILVLASVALTESYRILAIFPFNSKSHFHMFDALMQGLAKHNHQIDIVTHFPPKNPPKNYKVLVNLNGTLESLVDNFSFEFIESLNGDVVYYLSHNYGTQLCHLIKLDEMQKLIKNLPNVNPSYDLVITEAMGAPCYFGFGHLLKVPVIGLMSFEITPWLSESMGNPGNTAFAPHFFYGKFDKFNFWDRLRNTISYYWQVHKFNKLTESQTDIIRKYLSPDMPDVRELERNIALTLINRHPVFNGVKPLTSAMIEVSGLHVNTDSKLSIELQKWLDESVDGVVYFTFGSMVLFETLPVETINAFYKSFSKLKPVRVLMKVADEKKLPPGLPDNVKTLPWITQQAVLAHKNVRAFITHGGLISTQEALYFGVPMIGIPLFGDQYLNIASYESINIAVKINFNNVTTTSLDEALNVVLNDPKYRKNAQFYSKLFKDRPMKAMDTAIFWVEYIIRNGGEVLKSPAIELSSWQVALLDVYAFILFCLICVICFIYYSTKFVIHKCFEFSSRKLKKS